MENGEGEQKMKISYHKDTDSLYIHLNDAPTVESEEVAPDTVLHFDEDGNATGIEIYSEASGRVDLAKLQVSGLEDETAPTVRVSNPALARGGHWLAGIVKPGATGRVWAVDKHRPNKGSFVVVPVRAGESHMLKTTIGRPLRSLGSGQLASTK